MTSFFLEIVQLASGEIVLKRADEDSEPLVNIRFSDESIDMMGGAQLDVARAMIQAGMQAAAHVSEKQAKKTSSGEDALAAMDSEESAEPILH